MRFANFKVKLVWYMKFSNDNFPTNIEFYENNNCILVNIAYYTVFGTVDHENSCGTSKYKGHFVGIINSTDLLFV